MVETPCSKLMHLIKIFSLTMRKVNILKNIKIRSEIYLVNLLIIQNLISKQKNLYGSIINSKIIFSTSEN